MFAPPDFAATNWSTIDKGLSRLPEAFWGTRAANRTIMGRKIVKLSSTSDGKGSLHWKANNTASVLSEQSASYDYAIVSAPFSVVRYWRLPAFSSVLGRAIKNLVYSSACEVALQFKSRFWEHFEQPILGGCSSSDIPGIGSTCYPSYKVGALSACRSGRRSGVLLLTLSPRPDQLDWPGRDACVLYFDRQR